MPKRFGDFHRCLRLQRIGNLAMDELDMEAVDGWDAANEHIRQSLEGTEPWIIDSSDFAQGLSSLPVVELGVDADEGDKEATSGECVDKNNNTLASHSKTGCPSNVYTHKQTMKNCREMLCRKSDGMVVLGTKEKDKLPVNPVPVLVDPDKLTDLYSVKSKYYGRRKLVIHPSVAVKEALPTELVKETTERIREEIRQSVTDNRSGSSTGKRKRGSQKGKKKKTERQSAMLHTGLTAQSFNPGVFVHSCMTEKDHAYSESRTKNGGKRSFSFKLMHYYAGSHDKKMESALRFIGISLFGIYVRFGDEYTRKTIDIAHGMWFKMMALASHYVLPTMDTANVINNLFGSYHTTCTMGCGNNDSVTKEHRDPFNASQAFNSVHDFHLSLAETEQIGMVFYMNTGSELRPFIVPQRLFAFSAWYAHSTWHSTVHIGTYLRYLQPDVEETTVIDHQGIVAPLHECYKKPVPNEFERVYLTLYTKRNLPQLACVYDQYRAIGELNKVKMVEVSQGEKGKLQSNFATYHRRITREEESAYLRGVGMWSASDVDNAQDVNRRVHSNWVDVETLVVPR